MTEEHADSIWYTLPSARSESGAPARFKRIHMPGPLHQEIVKFVATSEAYEMVAELCREAGRLLIEHYGLRERYGQEEE